MNDFEDLDDYDYEYEQEELKRDTWFALTDGQYGDYPGKLFCLLIDFFRCQPLTFLPQNIK